MIKIYLTTYKKYNNGSLSGLWIDLPMTETGLRQKMQKAAFPERIYEAEFMIADTEIPTGLDFRAISEDEDIHKLNKEIAELKEEKAIAKLSPVVQKVLDEYRKAGESTKWMKYYRENMSNAIEFGNGSLYEFKTPSIETHFCFCEDYNGAYCEDTAKAAQNMARAAHREDYFTEENMRRAFKHIEWLLKQDIVVQIPMNRTPSIVYLDSPDYRGCGEIREPYYYWTDEQKAKYPQITDKDRENLKNVLEEEKAKFMTRLKKWYKRYGADGIRSWTYYSD